MNDHSTTVVHREQLLAALAAELTAAAYAVALRHAVGDRWLDLQLELWQVLAETLKKWGDPLPQGDDPGRCAAPTRLFKGPERNDTGGDMCHEDDSDSLFTLD